jgi:hypothetical protein
MFAKKNHLKPVNISLAGFFIREVHYEKMTIEKFYSHLEFCLLVMEQKYFTFANIE